jgi:hypothetical protein
MTSFYFLYVVVARKTTTRRLRRTVVIQMDRNGTLNTYTVRSGWTVFDRRAVDEIYPFWSSDQCNQAPPCGKLHSGHCSLTVMTMVMMMMIASPPTPFHFNCRQASARAPLRRLLKWLQRHLLGGNRDYSRYVNRHAHVVTVSAPTIGRCRRPMVAVRRQCVVIMIDKITVMRER